MSATIQIKGFQSGIIVFDGVLNCEKKHHMCLVKYTIFIMNNNVKNKFLNFKFDCETIY